MPSLTYQQIASQSEFRSFANDSIAGQAGDFDRNGALPPSLIAALAKRNYLAPWLPMEAGGSGMDMVTYGLLTEALGSACSSVRSLLTVQSMVASAVFRWGTISQRSLLPALASGEKFAAFALTEAQAGSSVRGIHTTAERIENGFHLNGHKKWVTFGRLADLYLIFAQWENKPCAFIVDRNAQGLTVNPVTTILGTRASMIADVILKDCFVPAENIVGAPGFGLSHVAGHALDLGRYSVAWGCVGIIRACLEASVEYTENRFQSGVSIGSHQLVRRMISEMLTKFRTAELLCREVGRLRDLGDPNAVSETLIAKYYASTCASAVAADAVQLHGANGCGADYSVERYWRDSKVMEIIEGTTQIHQINIAEYAYQNFGPKPQS